MPDQSERRDNPTRRVEELLRRTGSVSPWDFSRIMDEAVDHAGDSGRADTLESTRPWRSLGPRNIGGRIRALAQDERHPDVLYAGGGQGGLWKSNDAGDSWKVLDDFRPPERRQGLPIGAIAVSYSNPEVVYVGTGEPTRSTAGGARDIPGNGLFWSRNGGEQFTRIDHPDPDEGVIGAGQYERIIIDPWEPRRFWIASPDRGLARGLPRGLSDSNAPALQRDNVDTTGAPAAGSQRASDIAIDFGASRTAPPDTVTVFAALWGDGIYRAIYDRRHDRYQQSGGTAWTRVTPAFPAGVTRIKISLCRQRPTWLAAVAGIAGDTASNIFLRDFSGGAGWVDTGSRAGAGDTGTQSRYDLVLELHPRDPNIIITGSVELFLGRRNAISGVTAWSRIINWLQHDRGDRAQHADQHALLFDAANPRRIWVGNDGGLSTSPDLGGRWRERGLGISAAQFYDISTHPAYPYIFGGGLQDNGTWISYGGLTWYHVNGADGGDIGWHPTDPRRFLATWQSGIDQTLISSTTNALGTVDYMNRMPDVPLSAGSPVNHQAALTPLLVGFAAAHTPPFAGIVSNHPSTVNHAITGRRGAAYLTTNGTTFNRLNNLPAFTPANAFVSDLTYSPQHPNTHWWVATNAGELFFSNDANATAWLPRAPAGIAGMNITAIAINRTNDNIVAIAVTRRVSAADRTQGRVFISGDAGQHWNEISGRTAPCASGEDDRFNPSPATALAFDPASSGTVTDNQTLYCGNLAGIYVIRNARAPTAAGQSFSPAWRTFNNGMPLTLVFDLETVTYADAGGQNRHLLRCATHARGAYECDLNGTAAVRLLIRDNIVDDGKRYNGTHRQPGNHDPRMTAGPTAVMVLNRAIDIRIDTPPYQYLEQTIDGVEYDELLRADTLSANKLNLVHVQIHNVGAGISTHTRLHLFWARATGAPAVAPPLQADFWNLFPEIPDGAAWQKIGSRNLDRLVSAEPRVITFRWSVPGAVTGAVALLAICEDTSEDSLDGAALGSVVDPATAGAFIGTQRRTALHITQVRPAPADALVRDGRDDTGLFGETAWAGRSQDIIVVQTPPALPATADSTYTDLNDPRITDVLDGSVNNHIFVRVHNKGGQPLSNVRVELFRVPPVTLHDPNTWVSIGAGNLASIPANSALFAPDIPFNTPADPGSAKGYILVALINADGDPRPDFLARVDSVSSFWQLFLEAVDSGNAAMKGVRWQP